MLDHFTRFSAITKASLIYCAITSSIMFTFSIVTLVKICKTGEYRHLRRNVFLIIAYSIL